MASWLPIFALKEIGFVRFYRRVKRPAALPDFVLMVGLFVRAVAAPRLALVNPLI